MKTKYKLVLLLILISAIAEAQTINLSMSAYFYSWERTDSVAANSETSYLKGYQNLSLEVAKDKWSLNTSLLTQEDMVASTGDGFDYSFYNLYVKGSNLWKVLDMKIGRQYVYAGVGNGMVDGLYLKYKGGMNKQYQLSVFGGALTPGNYDFQSYSDFNNNFIFGSAFNYYGDQGLTASLSYFLQRKQYAPYTAPRINTSYITIDEEIVTDSKYKQLIGLNFSYTGKQKYTLFGKAYYDLYIDKFYQTELNFSYPYKNFRISADYTYRTAQLTYNTTFWTMAQYWPLSHYQEIEGSVDYYLKNGINLFATISDVIYIDDNGLKYQAGFKKADYGLYYVGYSGYSGVSNGFTGYVYHNFIPSALSANLTLNYSNYYIGNYSVTHENQFSCLLGLTYRPITTLSIDAQGQFITNEIYSIDSRFLVGLNYRLFSKF
jgi:hypothetical protein